MGGLRMSRQVTIDHWPHPVTDEGRSVRRLDPSGLSLGDLVAREAGPGDWAVMIDGRRVPHEELQIRHATGGEIVTVTAYAEKSVARVVATIALLAFVPFVPGLLGITSKVGAAIASAAALVVGGMLINAAFPMRPPGINLAGGADPEAADPVFSLSGGQNRARINQPLPLVMGRHRMFPDLGAKEYTEFVNGEQYLNAIFNAGFGDLAITDLRIGESPSANYEEVQTEFAPNGASIELVAGNVDSVAGGDLADTDFVVRDTPDMTKSVGVDLTGRIFAQDESSGELVDHTVQVQIRTQALVNGQPSGAAETATLDITRGTQTPLRETWTKTFARAGKWRISVRRTLGPSDSSRIADDLTWAALSSYQEDTATYAGENRMAMRIRASGQWQHRLDRVSALYSQKVPAWNQASRTWGSANVATSNPAAIYRWYCRGVDVDGDIVAGVGLAASRIDDAKLGAWHEWCRVKGYTFDFVLASAATHDAVLTMIAQAGRAAPSWQGGRLGVVYEDENVLPTGLVSPQNIIAGSFGYSYAGGTAADEIVVQYVEPDLDWQVNTVKRRRPGLAGSPKSTVTVRAQGVTSRRNAAIEANLTAAHQTYHRRVLRWRMGREGRYFPRGSVVWITHSLIDGGIAGRLRGGTMERLTLDRAVTIDDDRTWILVRSPQGTLRQSRLRRTAGESREVELVSALVQAPGDADAALDWSWRIYDQARPPRKARITSVRPRSERLFEFTAIDEVPEYFDAATSDLSVPLPTIRPRTPEVLNVQFSATDIRVGSGYAVELRAALNVRGDWRGGIVRAGPDFNSLSVVDRLVDGDTEARWIIPPGTGQAVEIAPGTASFSAGPTWRGTWRVTTGPLPPPPSSLAVTVSADGTRVVDFDPPAIPDLAGVVIRYARQPNTLWDNMTRLHDGILTAAPYETLVPAAGTWTFVARTKNTAGYFSAETRLRSVVLGRTRSRGIEWHVGTANPAANLGNDGDIYVNQSSNTLWRKTAGAWAQFADLSGADGAQWYSGNGEPSATLGVAGDWYFRTGTGARAAEIWRKAADGWGRLVDIDQGQDGEDGATWLSGSGYPDAASGRLGDHWFQTSNGHVYERTADVAWETRGSTATFGFGPANNWSAGDGSPDTSLGIVGDAYVDEASSTIWRKASSGWTEVADLSVGEGAQWWVGTAAPASGDGAAGDWFYRPSTGELWEKTHWQFQFDATGPQGRRGTLLTAGNRPTSEEIPGDMNIDSDGNLVRRNDENSDWESTGVRLRTGPRETARLYNGDEQMSPNETLSVLFDTSQFDSLSVRMRRDLANDVLVSLEFDLEDVTVGTNSNVRPNGYSRFGVNSIHTEFEFAIWKHADGIRISRTTDATGGTQYIRSIWGIRNP